MKYMVLAELQELMEDRRFVRVLRELAERGSEPERSFALLLLAVQERFGLGGEEHDRASI